MSSNPKKPSREKRAAKADALPLSGSKPVGRNSSEAEPVAGGAAAPIWLVILLGGVFYWSQLYLDRTAAGFDDRVYAPFVSVAEVEFVQPKDPAALLALKGKAIYEQRCQACHQPNGMGQPGTFPPLDGSDWVLTPGPGRMLRAMLNGLIGPIQVKGTEYNNNMPPGLTEGLSDEEIAGVATYVRRAWSNKGSAVTPTQVKALKEAQGSRAAQWTASELLAVPETE